MIQNEKTENAFDAACAQAPAAAGVKTGDVLCFGRPEESCGFLGRWLVLDAEHTNTGGEGMFIVSLDLIGSAEGGPLLFRDIGEVSVSFSDTGRDYAAAHPGVTDYRDSDIRRWCGDFAKEYLSAAEREALIPTDKSDTAIVIPGLITPDRATAYYSKVLNIFEPIECSEFARYISYPTVLLHDTGSAAYAEAVFNEEIPSFFYLMVSDSIGGASVINGAVQHGSNCRCGEIGHVHLVKNGRQCYCGLKGCVDPYCSTRVLSQYTGGKLDQFFEVLEAGDQKASDIWNEYLDYLALAIHDIRMLFDGEIVLGGYLGLYIEPYMEDLKKRVIHMDPFIDEADYLKVCKCRLEAAASGGALQYIQNVFQFI